MQKLLIFFYSFCTLLELESIGGTKLLGLKRLAESFAEAFLNNENGATMLEYAIMAGFIAAVAAVAIASLGNVVRDLFVPVSSMLGS